MEALATIDGVTVVGSAGGQWTLTLDSTSLDASDVALLVGDGLLLVGGVGTQTFTIAEQTRSAGPNNFDAACNWVDNRVLDSTA